MTAMSTREREYSVPAQDPGTEYMDNNARLQRDYADFKLAALIICGVAIGASSIVSLANVPWSDLTTLLLAGGVGIVAFLGYRHANSSR